MEDIDEEKKKIQNEKKKLEAMRNRIMFEK